MRLYSLVALLLHFHVSHAISCFNGSVITKAELCRLDVDFHHSNCTVERSHQTALTTADSIRNECEFYGRSLRCYCGQEDCNENLQRLLDNSLVEHNFFVGYDIGQVRDCVLNHFEISRFLEKRRSVEELSNGNGRIRLMRQARAKRSRVKNQSAVILTDTTADSTSDAETTSALPATATVSQSVITTSTNALLKRVLNDTDTDDFIYVLTGKTVGNDGALYFYIIMIVLIAAELALAATFVYLLVTLRTRKKMLAEKAKRKREKALLRTVTEASEMRSTVMDTIGGAENESKQKEAADGKTETHATDVKTDVDTLPSLLKSAEPATKQNSADDQTAAVPQPAYMRADYFK